MGGFSQLTPEGRSDKLWIPQDTAAQQAKIDYEKYFPPAARRNSIMLEAKGNNALDKAALQDAMALHDKIELVKAGNDTLRTLCLMRPSAAHPCFVQSVLEFWHFDKTKLDNDANPLATINAAGKSQDDLRRLLGSPTFAADGKVVSAKVLMMNYFLKSRLEKAGGGLDDPRGEAWEEEFLKVLKCDDPVCATEETCTCSYESKHFTTYVWATRSFSDVFGSLIRGDVGLINAAFFVMAIYITLNLGGLCHKIKSRALLALGSLLCIVLAGAAGYGIAMYMQFKYTPVMSVLPFVLLGIGVDDSFVIMNALDRVDPNLPINERIAHALSHAGVSIMFTSVTDFVAFAISISSALPALSAFCAYAAFSILMMFVLQVFIFTAFATFDARRVASHRIDCCPCICANGCPCCKTVPANEAIDAETGKDKNQLCCAASPHPGGRMGIFLQNTLAPAITKTPVAIGILVASVAFSVLCIWMASQLPVEDIVDKFIPDDSYVQTYIKMSGEYFGSVPVSVSIVTTSAHSRLDDYSAVDVQKALAAMGSRVDELGQFEPSSGDTFMCWAPAYTAAIKAGSVGVAVAHDGNGYATDRAQYFTGLKTWLGAAGAAYGRDVVWVDDADAQKGITATRCSAQLKPMWIGRNGKLEIDEDKAVVALDKVMEGVAAWTGLPGGKAFAYARDFLSWEVYRIIKREMFMSVGLCMLAVLILTMIIIAHPGAAFLVFLSVGMVVVDLLGCMHLWGLAIDNVSVIQLVIAVGLAVDYSAHIGHNFMTKQGTNAERVILTMGDVGSAVLNGGVSTFLAVMLLAGSKSYVFRVLFVSFFLTVVVGLFHGMIVLPAMLALAGPQGYAGRVTEGSGPGGKTIGKGDQDAYNVKE